MGISSSRMRWLARLLLDRPHRLAALVCVAAFPCLPVAQAQAQSQVSAAVSRGSLRGILTPLYDLQLSSRAAGVIEELPVAEGQTIKKGDLLVQLNADIERAEVTQAEAVLEAAEAEFERMQREFERAKALRRDSIGSERDFENAESQVIRAAAQKKQATAALDVARARLRERGLYAPIDGLMFKRTKEVGEAVERLETVVRVVDASKLELVVFAGAELFGRFRNNETVDVSLEDGLARGRTVQGTIVHVDPIIDSQSGTFRVRVQVLPSNEVQPGLTAHLNLPQEQTPSNHSTISTDQAMNESFQVD